MSDQADRSAPWTQALSEQFPDEATRTQVDSFMRENYQPYVTRLEQDSADARRLYDDLINDPGQTWLAISEELFGEDKAGELQKLVSEAAAEVAEQQEATPPATPPQGALPDDDREVLDAIKADRQQAAYDKALSDFKATEGHEDLEEKWFHPFVAAADGDLEAAYAGYKEWLGDVQQRFAPAVEGEQPPPPPSVIGSQTQTAQPAAAQTQPQKQTMDEALDDMFDDLRAAAPPTVGSV